MGSSRMVRIFAVYNEALRKAGAAGTSEKELSLIEKC